MIKSIFFHNHKNPHLYNLHFSKASKRWNKVDTPKNPIFAPHISQNTTSFLFLSERITKYALLSLGHIGDGLILQVFADFEHIATVSHRLDHGLGNVGRWNRNGGYLYILNIQPTLFGITLGVQRVNSCYVGVPATEIFRNKLRSLFNNKMTCSPVAFHLHKL